MMLRFSLLRCAPALLSLIVLVLAGCGGTSSPGTTTLRVWYSTDDPGERAWSQTLAQHYERTHPNVKVQLTDYSFEDLNTKLQLALSGGRPPDVAYVTPRGPGIPAYVRSHSLIDLAGAARRHGWASRLRSGLLTQYNDPFRFYGAPAKAVVAVPTSLAAVGVLYNRQLLDRLGLGIPRTLAEFETALAVAKKAGYTPIGMGNADGWLGDDWYQTLVEALIPPTSLQPEQRLDKSFSFKQPEFLQAARMLADWAKSGYFTRDFGGLDAQEGIDVFFHGKTLFQLISSSQNLQIAQDERETHLPIGVFAFPRRNGGTVMAQSGYLGWIVPKASDKQKEAVSFITSLLQPSVSALIAQRGFLPAHAETSPVHSGPAKPRTVPVWQDEFRRALQTAQPGPYIDAAPIANMNATMEANVQLLLQGYEAPEFLVKSLQEVYASGGAKGSTARIDGEF